MDKLFELIFSDSILPYVIGAIAAIYGWIKRRANIKDERISKSILFLEEGVEECWDAYVKDIKKSGDDRKLTKEEKNRALTIAKDKAIRYAKEEGWDLFKYIAKSTIPVIIKKIVDGRKDSK